MIEYNLKFDGWTKPDNWQKGNLSMLWNFNIHLFKINGKVFARDTKEFRDEIEKVKAWERLNVKINKR